MMLCLNILVYLFQISLSCIRVSMPQNRCNTDVCVQLSKKPALCVLPGCLPNDGPCPCFCPHHLVSMSIFLPSFWFPRALSLNFYISSYYFYKILHLKSTSVWPSFSWLVFLLHPSEGTHTQTNHTVNTKIPNVFIKHAHFFPVQEMATKCSHRGIVLQKFSPPNIWRTSKSVQY